jgi:hypothetical protein
MVMTWPPKAFYLSGARTYEEDSAIICGRFFLTYYPLFLYIQSIPKQVLINLFKEFNCLLTSGFKDLSAHAETLSSTPSACPLPKGLSIIPLRLLSNG